MKSSVGSLVYYFMEKCQKNSNFIMNKKKNKLKFNARDPNLLCNYVQLMKSKLKKKKNKLKINEKQCRIPSMGKMSKKFKFYK